jgi:V-type H+-transporting ATPase subunit C
VPETAGAGTAFPHLKQNIQGQADVFLFRVPQLRIGTLDALMMLSDDLGKYDVFVEMITRKIANQLLTLCENPNQAQHILSVNTGMPPFRKRLRSTS